MGALYCNAFSPPLLATDQNMPVLERLDVRQTFQQTGGIGHLPDIASKAVEVFIYQIVANVRGWEWSSSHGTGLRRGYTINTELLPRFHVDSETNALAKQIMPERNILSDEVVRIGTTKEQYASHSLFNGRQPVARDLAYGIDSG
jgi:hypothetical protein